MSQQFIEVELGGKVRLLRFDYNAVCDIEQQFGKGIASIFSQEQIGFNVVRLFYWAGLKWKDQGLTTQRVCQLLQEEMENGSDLNALVEPIMKALKQSKLLGESGNDEKNE